MATARWSSLPKFQGSRVRTWAIDLEFDMEQDEWSLQCIVVEPRCEQTESKDMPPLPSITPEVEQQGRFVYVYFLNKADLQMIEQIDRSWSGDSENDKRDVVKTCYLVCNVQGVNIRGKTDKGFLLSIRTVDC